MDTGIIPARAGFTMFHVKHCCPNPGSSPLARGLPSSSRVYMASMGIIPARAGFTLRPTRDEGSRLDHPRSRGVYLS